jgi:hypothetical protein
MTTERHFYRCQDCLTVAAVDIENSGDRLRFPVCGHCDGRLEYMGRVSQARLVKDEERCACDDRCICARGPICNCKCGGKYHGAGMLAPVIYTTRDCGPVPVVSMPANSKANRTAKEFRDAIQAAGTRIEAIRAGIVSAVDPMPNGSPGCGLYKTDGLIRRARRSRSHSHRMKLLAPFIPATTATQPLTPTVTLSGPITSTGPRRQLSLI